MLSIRQLRNKIQAVENISQMTKAMELVSATKMRRAQEYALRGRPYAMHALSLLSRLAGSSEEYIGSLWKKREKGNICLVVITSDKGLAGSFNSAVLRKASQYITEKKQKGEMVEVVAVGKKARDFFKKQGISIPAEFFRFSDVYTLQDALPLANWILETYEKGEYKEINFCSTIFISALLQKPFIHLLLPLDAKELNGIIDSIIPQHGRYAQMRIDKIQGGSNIQYVFEPSPWAILETLARDLVKVAVFHLLLESNASEHSARMLAMKNATDNAVELIDELTIQLNKARQTAITQELSEILTAKETLLSDK